MTERETTERLIVLGLSSMGTTAIIGVIWLSYLGREVPGALATVIPFVAGALAGVLHSPSPVKRIEDGAYTKPPANPPNGMPPGR